VGRQVEIDTFIFSGADNIPNYVSTITKLYLSKKKRPKVTP